MTTQFQPAPAAEPSTLHASVSPSASRIPSLDALRGLSIWAVMAAHASTHFPSPWQKNRLIHGTLASLSYFGVTTFFVISGFLITKLLLQERARTGDISLKRFYRRRAFRILPASVFYLLAVLIFAKPTLLQTVIAATFTTTYAFSEAYKPLQQLWSLSMEEQFYLLWPLILWTGLKNAKRYCWLVLFASPAIRLYLKWHGYPEYSHLAPAIADSIIAGCLLAFYEAEVRAFARKYLLKVVPFLCLGGFTTLAAIAAYWRDVVLVWGAVSCLIALTIAVAIERRDTVLNRGFLVWTGLLSYSLYLWQQPFLVFDGPLNNFPCRIAATFVMAFVSYKFVEQPFVRWDKMKVKAARARKEEAANGTVEVA